MYTDYKGNKIKGEWVKLPKVDEGFDNLLDTLDGLTKENTGINLEDSYIEKLLTKNKPDKLKMVKIWFRQWDKGFKPQWIRQSTANHRLGRFLESQVSHYYTPIDLPLSNGKTTKVLVRKFFTELKDDPVIYVEFAANGQKPHQDSAHQQCVNEILNGFEFEGNKYEYCMSSSSQMRLLKGVFVRKDYTLPETYLDKFDQSIDGMNKYTEFLKSLTGSEAILEVMTFGAYSHYFTDKYSIFLGNKVTKPKVYSASKFSDRAGKSLTSSISLGRNFRIKHMGQVKYVWTDYIENQIKSLTYKDSKGNSRRIYNNSDIEKIKTLWKESKLDGQGIIRASALIRAFKSKMGITLTKEEAIGLLPQTRIAGQKGTLLVMDDDILDKCKGPLGGYVYKGYDIIVEHNSWKYTHAKYYTGAVAPELELCNISSRKFSNFINYQLINALDGYPNNQKRSIKVFKGLVDKQINDLKSCLTNPSKAKARQGMIEKKGPLDAFGIDEYQMTQKSKVSIALETDENAIFDNWVRNKYINIFRKTREECKVGKIEVEGANRYIISDPIALLRTDLMNDNGDIIITKPEQVGLGTILDCYWAGKETEAVLFRNPCVHPGEPQRINLVGLDKMPKITKTAFGDIPTRKIYKASKDIVIINGFSFILDALGGASL